MIATFPPLVLGYLQDTLIQAADPVLLSFGHDWQLRGASGDATRFGGDTTRLGAHLRDVFHGLRTDELQVFAAVELPNARHVHAHLIPDSDTPDGAGFHVVLLDAEAETQQRQRAQQLGNQAELASQEKSRALKRLKRAHAELEQQRSQLEQGSALKDALMATLSHEFRTPLTAIFGYLHLLEKGQYDTEMRTPALRSVRRAATHLYALSENLLEYARERKGGSLVDPQAISASALADELRDMFEPIAQNGGLALNVEAQEAAGEQPISDPTKLRQILINLISNALRYTPAGSVEVRIAASRAGLDLSVKDTGVGISEELRPRLYKPFERGDARGGAGLGLAITQRLVEQLGGRIEFESQPGTGTTFRVNLPSLARLVAVAAAFAERPQPSETARRVGGRALVVDDDPDLRSLLRTLLQDLGFSVQTTDNANDAVELALGHKPDLMVLDMEMPGLPGSAAAFRLRGQGYKGRIVMLSATPTAETQAGARAAGADAFLTKPLDMVAFAIACRG